MEFNIPNTFTLGGVEHKVEIRDTVLNNDFGYFDVLGKILIAKQSDGKDITKSKQHQTFFHELTHAILFTMRKDDLYEDEQFVNTFSSFLNEAINTMDNR